MPVIRIGFFISAFVAMTFSCHAEYKVGPQERLRIKVHEWPALTDEVTVSEEGTIVLPVVGALQVAGTGASGIADMLASRLQAVANLAELPQASVEVSQYRPFYILGDVQKPGEYPFRPGITMEIALALAGGAYRVPENQANRYERDLISVRGTIFALQRKRVELLVQQARIQAELAGAADFRFEDQSVKDVSSDQLRAMVVVESGMMKSRKQSLANQRAGNLKQIAIFNEEIAFLNARMASAIKQQNSVEREINGMKGLSERGLVSLPRQATLDRLSAQIEGDQREVDTRIARARESIALAEAAIRKSADDSDRELNQELRQSIAQSNDVEQQLTMQRDLLTEAESMVAISQVARSSRFQVQLKFAVSRRTPGGFMQSGVNELDLLEPGDVVKVEQIPSYVAPAQGVVLR